MTDPDATCHRRLPLDQDLPCGHPYRVHEHDRPGTDCGARYCGCWAFKGAPLLVRLTQWATGGLR